MKLRPRLWYHVHDDSGMETLQSVAILAAAAMVLISMKSLWTPSESGGTGLMAQVEGKLQILINGGEDSGGGGEAEITITVEPFPPGNVGTAVETVPEEEDVPPDESESSTDNEPEVLVWEPGSEILRDSKGNIVATRDIGLESPIYDPIDFFVDVISLGTATAAREIYATIGVSITTAVIKHISSVRQRNGVVTIVMDPSVDPQE